MKTCILVFGESGSGKSTVTENIVSQYNDWLNNVLVINGDYVRSGLSSDLGFDAASRLEQARRMGCLANLALRCSHLSLVIVDFIAPTSEARSLFESRLMAKHSNASKRESGSLAVDFSELFGSDPIRLYKIWVRSSSPLEFNSRFEAPGDSEVVDLVLDTSQNWAAQLDLFLDSIDALNT